MEMNPHLAAAVESFRLVQIDNWYSDQPDEPATMSVDFISRDGNIAEGYCDVISEAFVAHLAAAGIDATVIHNDERIRYARNHEHYAVEVDGLLIDWTAAQFLGAAANVIERVLATGFVTGDGFHFQPHPDLTAGWLEALAVLQDTEPTQRADFIEYELSDEGRRIGREISEQSLAFNVGWERALEASV